MKNPKRINLAMTWEVSVQYLMVVIETHAKKSFLKQDSEGVSPRDTVRDVLQNCGRLADMYVDHTKKGGVMNANERNAYGSIYKESEVV
jgi:hypothetical protein